MTALQASMVLASLRAGSDRWRMAAGWPPAAEDVAAWSERLGRMYVPKPIAVPLVQFLAQDQPVSTRVMEDPRLGWRGLCRAGFHACPVPGGHATLFAEPHAARLGALLGETLAARTAAAAR